VSFQFFSEGGEGRKRGTNSEFRGKEFPNGRSGKRERTTTNISLDERNME